MENNSQKKLISIITPCWNEEDNIRECCSRVEALFERELTNYSYEHIFADNDSTDSTLCVLKEMAAQDKRIKIIVNARNFGPVRSNFNALKTAKGDAIVVLLSADMQDPPELIVDFVRKWEEGYYVVYGIRSNREESIVIRMARGLFYAIITRVSFVSMPKHVGEFALIDKLVLKSLLQSDDYYPYIRGMIANCGMKSIGIEFDWKARKRGVSKTNFLMMVNQALNGIISFTNMPLRLCTLLGMLLSGLSILVALFVIIMNFCIHSHFTTSGIFTLTVALFFFSGVQLFFLGVLGEYISAIHFQVRKRHVVVEKERVNFDE